MKIDTAAEIIFLKKLFLLFSNYFSMYSINKVHSK